MNVLFALFIAAATFGTNASRASIDLASLQRDLKDVRKSIEAATRDANAYEGGALKQMALFRLETLKLSEALLQQRLIAQESGLPMQESLSVQKPDPSKLNTILAELQSATTELRKAETEASEIRGLMGLMAQLRVMTVRAQIETLKLAAYQSTYGLELPAPPPPELDDYSTATSPNTNSSTNQNLEGKKSLPAWADPKFPEIDYSAAVFQQLSNEGYTFKGWWAVQKGKAQIDDSPTAFAINVHPLRDNAQARNKYLALRCNERQSSFIYAVGDYLLTPIDTSTAPVTYRIDRNPAQSDQWSLTTDHEAVGKWGDEAIELMTRLFDSKKFFIRTTERGGETHDISVELAGVDGAIELVAAACDWAPLTKDELKLIQAGLKSAGLYSGNPDGRWGPGTKAALLAWFRKSNGAEKLPEARAEYLKMLEVN